MKWIMLALAGSMGLSAFAGGLIWLAKRYRIIKNGVEVEGLVTGQHEERVKSSGLASRYSQTHITFYPIVEFTNDRGETVRFQGSSGGVGIPLIETGSKVKVVYIPTDPTLAVIGDFTRTWLGPVVLSAVGVVCLILALGSFAMIGHVNETVDDMSEIMKREALTLRSNAIHIEATIREIRELGGKGSGKYVFICKGLRPGGSFSEEFMSDYFTFKPDSSLIGRTVSVYIDPSDTGHYKVDLDSLLKEILDRSNATAKNS